MTEEEFKKKVLLILPKYILVDGIYYGIQVGTLLFTKVYRISYFPFNGDVFYYDIPGLYDIITESWEECIDKTRKFLKSINYKYIKEFLPDKKTKVETITISF